ncbi:hypothetical protein SteCoe_28108 [Stentor coeruleus]|uniref:Hexose transporter 1 n=1 Tax=Stentor coeruleus TaxID=5963 RepID=A0A1R2B8Y5_9CILI|nr:hypothetical protein SteCoe_28108 [Stentor coeruleus]
MEKEENIKHGQVWKICLHIVIASFVFYYTVGVFNPCTENVAASLNWGSRTSLYVTIFSSLVSLGTLIGASCVGYFLDHYGRRTTMMWNDILYIVGTIILVMPSTTTFGIGRFLTGLTTGFSATLVPIYIAETTPEDMSHKVGPLILISHNLGLMSAFGFGLALPTENFNTNPFNYWWIFMFLFPAALCLYQLIYFKYFCIFDTPLFYMGKNDIENAKKALEMTYTEVGMEVGMKRLQSEYEGKTTEGVKISLVYFICKKRFRKMVRVGCILCVLEQFSGISPIIFYSTIIFGKMGGGIFLSRLLTFIMGLGNMISALISIPLLKFIGRKRLLVIGHFILAIDLLILGIFSGHVQVGVLVPAIFLILFMFLFSLALGATLWIYIGEVLNDQILSFSLLLNSITDVVLAFLFQIVGDAIGINNVFLFFAFIMLIGTVYSQYDLIETKGKQKEQILIEMKVIEKRENTDNTIKNDNSADDRFYKSTEQDRDDSVEYNRNSVLTVI